MNITEELSPEVTESSSLKGNTQFEEAAPSAEGIKNEKEIKDNTNLESKMSQLKSLYENGLLTEEEYKTKKEKILEEL